MENWLDREFVESLADHKRKANPFVGTLLIDENGGVAEVRGNMDQFLLPNGSEMTFIGYVQGFTGVVTIGHSSTYLYSRVEKDGYAGTIDVLSGRVDTGRPMYCTFNRIVPYFNYPTQVLQAGTTVSLQFIGWLY